MAAHSLAGRQVLPESAHRTLQGDEPTKPGSGEGPSQTVSDEAGRSGICGLSVA